MDVTCPRLLLCTRYLYKYHSWRLVPELEARLKLVSGRGSDKLQVNPNRVREAGLN